MGEGAEVCTAGGDSACTSPLRQREALPPPPEGEARGGHYVTGRCARSRALLGAIRRVHPLSVSARRCHLPRRGRQEGGTTSPGRAPGAVYCWGCYSACASPLRQREALPPPPEGEARGCTTAPGGAPGAACCLPAGQMLRAILYYVTGRSTRCCTTCVLVIKVCQ